VFGLEKVNYWNPIRTSAIQSRSRSMRFLSFYNHEKGAPKQKISKWRTVCNTFLRSGWSIIWSASLAKRGTSKKRPSPHLQKVPTRSNNVSPQSLQTALVIICHCTSSCNAYLVINYKEYRINNPTTLCVFRLIGQHPTFKGFTKKV
jgi:hypothetical protein